MYVQERMKKWRNETTKQLQELGGKTAGILLLLSLHSLHSLAYPAPLFVSALCERVCQVQEFGGKNTDVDTHTQTLSLSCTHTHTHKCWYVCMYVCM